MTAPVIALSPSPVDPDDGLPAGWSASAKATYAEVVREYPDLDAVTLSILFEAVALIALADAAMELVDRDGLMTRGSRGQVVPNPLIAEARLHRVQAVAALKALGLARGQSSASAAGAALVAKRYRGRTAGVRGA